MKKLRTNFEINVSKISYAIESAKAMAKAAALAAKGDSTEVPMPTSLKIDQNVLDQQ